jgi:hypothetical protein
MQYRKDTLLLARQRQPGKFLLAAIIRIRKGQLLNESRKMILVAKMYFFFARARKINPPKLEIPAFSPAQRDKTIFTVRKTKR